MKDDNKKLEGDINIKKYKEIAKNNDYNEFYKKLKDDFSIIRKAPSERNLDNDEDYFNFLISFWNNLKIFGKELSLNFYIEEYLKNNVNFKFENYKEYYSKNSEKFFIEKSDDPKVITLRNNIYIHQKAIERLILEDVKTQFNIEDKDVEIQLFLNKIGTRSSSLFSKSINSYSVDFYGNYVDTSIRFQPLNFFSTYIF